MTHLATGRLLLDGDIPRHDVYTFTADGDPWVVQSWLASLLYAAADDVAGGDGIRIVVGMAMAGLVGVGWALTRSAETLAGRLVTVLPFFVVGLAGWQERPYLFGLLFLGLTLLVVEDRVRPAWLLPVGWLWLNTHGSWPLALVAIAALALGRRLDRQPAGDELAALRWLAGGLALGALNPYGPRLWVFPFELLGKREALRTIAEWRAPSFEDVDELAFLLVILLGLLALRRAPSWRAALPLLVFIGAALLGARNIPVAALVTLPTIAVGLRGIGSVSGAEPQPALRLAVPALAVAAIGLGAARLDQPAFDLDAYPVEATRWLEANGLDPRANRVVAPDYVGNFWELRYGAAADVFVDDRVEVLPTAVFLDFTSLAKGREDWEAILDRYEPQAVLWPAGTALDGLLERSRDWELIHEGDGFVVYLAPDAALGAESR